MRIRIAQALALSTLLFTHVSRADRPWLVGELGDFSQIEFRGNDSFPADKLVSALDSDFALLPASRPLASLATLLSTLETELQHGYRHQGFPAATVTADYDEAAQSIAVEIVEGPQFENGPVIVTGVAGDLEQLLIERLTEDEKPAAPMLPNAQPPAAGVQTTSNQKRQALWEEDVPTSFTDFQGNELVKRLLETMNEAGYLEAHVDIELVPDAASGLTRLIVDIVQGPATSVGEIEIVGIERHTPTDIEDYLGIEVGMPCDLFTRRAWERRLEESGRFALHAITTSAIDGQPGMQLVKIELFECEDVPTLSEDLNDIDLALLRTAEWLAHPENFDGDLCVHGQGDLKTLCGSLSGVFGESETSDGPAFPEWLEGSEARFDLALSPQGAGILGVQVVSSTAVPLFGYAFEFSMERTSVYSSATTNALLYENESGPKPNATVTFTRQPTTPEGRKFGMTFGMGVSSDSGGLLQIRVTPAFMLSNARSRDASFEIRDGVLHAAWEGVRSQFDADTGRLIRCDCTSESGDFISVSIERNGIANAREACLGQARLTQLNHDQPPAIALGEFFAAETAWWASRLGNETESTRWNALARLLRNYDAASDVETVAFTAAENDQDDERFFIPASQAQAANPLSWVGQFVLMGNTALLSRGSPAWQVGREAVAAMILRDATAFAELERLSRDDACGPLTSLYAAELLQFVHPALEKVWADRGLRRLDAESLANDLNQLTNDTPLGEFLAEIIKELDRLPEAELQAVFAGIGDERVGHAITIVTESSVRPETRVQQLVQLLWLAGLKDRVQDRLADHLRSGMETTQR